MKYLLPFLFIGCSLYPNGKCDDIPEYQGCIMECKEKFGDNYWACEPMKNDACRCNYICEVKNECSL